MSDGNYRLPKGYNVASEAYYWGYQNEASAEQSPTFNASVMCTCGAWVTYGRDCGLEYHSPTVCDLLKEPEKKEVK